MFNHTRHSIVALFAGLAIWTMAVEARADIRPVCGYSAVTFAGLSEAFNFEAMIGCYAADQNSPNGQTLLVATRDQANPGAAHRVLAVDSNGNDWIVSQASQWPGANRCFSRMLRHPSDGNLMYILDAGAVSNPSVGPDGRLLLLNRATGAISTVIDTSFGLLDPTDLDRDPISGDLFIGDAGRGELPGSGKLYRWNGSVLTEVLGSGRPVSIAFLPDGTYLLSGLVNGVVGTFHMSGSTVLGTFANIVGNIVLHSGGGMPAGVYLLSESGPAGFYGLFYPTHLYWCPDSNGDWVADSVNLVATGDFRGTMVFDAAGRALVMDNVNEDIIAISPGGTCRGDMNCDGAVNNFDIDSFVEALTSPQQYQIDHPNCNIALGDMNCDQQVNNFDIDAFVNCITTGNCGCP